MTSFSWDSFVRVCEEVQFVTYLTMLAKAQSPGTVVLARLCFTSSLGHSGKRIRINQEKHSLATASCLLHFEPLASFFERA